jgi:hypothetical protein
MGYKTIFGVGFATVFLCGSSAFAAESAGVALAKLTEEVSTVPATTLSFNRDIRPILSDTCFACHGPDEVARKAEFRLDLESDAFKTLASGAQVIVRGNRADSVLYQRIATHDEDDRMPPSKAVKQLRAEQIETIGRWIDEGAQWERHWAFIPPTKPARPAVDHAEWVRSELDLHVLARLEREGLVPAAEAAPATLLRRASYDLTGLPPTPEEVDAFVKDTRPDAYERAIDRLLESPRYGEHMARFWLDLARYADTNGYHIDNERFMWRWREWVIHAFANNMPFDQFTVEQLAGDLLPEPTLEQRIATGFNRNHMINFEGGIIAEEYRVQYVVDRVSTTGTTWLGMSVGCAQCHEHKYDPISQKEFYELYAFFNTIAEEGSDGRNGNAVPFLQAPSPDQAIRLASYTEQVANLETELDAPIPDVDSAQATWEMEQQSLIAQRWAGVETTATTEGDGETGGSLVFTGSTDAFSITALRIDLLPLADDAEGDLVIQEIVAETAPLHSPDAMAKVPFTTATGDSRQPATQYAKLIDGKPDKGWELEPEDRAGARTTILAPNAPIGFPKGTAVRVRVDYTGTLTPERIRLATTGDEAMAPSLLASWYVSGPYRATDGATAYDTAYEPEVAIDLDSSYDDGRQKWTLVTPQYADGVVHSLPGQVCATYLYRKITAPSGRKMTVSLGSNDAIKAWANGRVIHDNNVQRGVEPDQDSVTFQLEPGENELLLKVVNYGNAYAFYFNKTSEQVGEIPLDIELILGTNPKERSDAQVTELRNYYRRLNHPAWKELESKLAALREEKTTFEKEIPTSMVMGEMEEPRETFVLTRGEYDKPGEQVTPGVPDQISPMDASLPTNRLGLARWLVAPQHPLTARVAVNRFWERIFGSGIVLTSEEFGSQGEWPSHPELLDWLATDFVASGWDVKALHKTILTSATYRQSSKTAPEMTAQDPLNRLLARGPRFRLDAEVVRDSALAASGLLVEKVGGPSVSPYQPKGIWEEVAYGAGFTAQVFEQGAGEELYRRSMYTFWKRQSPPPSMMVFDAPNREICTARRARTNTPLQALALLNDPQFVEAARAMAERVIMEAGPTPHERIVYAHKLATAREPNAQELDILLAFYEEQLDEYRSNTEGAEQYVQVGDSEPAANIDPVDLATWSSVTSMILNLDETITKG